MDYSSVLKKITICLLIMGLAGVGQAEQLTGGKSFDEAYKLEKGNLYTGGYLGENKNKDYFYFDSLKAGQEIIIECQLKGSGVITGSAGHVTLYNANQRSLASKDWGWGTEGGTTDLTLSWIAGSEEKNDRYYLKVDKNVGKPKYNIKTSVENHYDARSKTDAGKTYDTALEIEPGKYQGFMSGGDGNDKLDIYSLSLEKNETVKVSLTPPTEVSHGIQIFNQDRVRKKESLPSNPGAIVRASWKAPSAQKVYLKVVGRNDNPSGTYDFKVTTQGMEPKESTSTSTTKEAPNGTEITSTTIPEIPETPQGIVDLILEFLSSLLS